MLKMAVRKQFDYLWINLKYRAIFFYFIFMASLWMNIIYLGNLSFSCHFFVDLNLYCKVWPFILKFIYHFFLGFLIKYSSCWIRLLLINLFITDFLFIFFFLFYLIQTRYETLSE